MGNRTTHFMKVGLVLVSLFCILVFAAQTFFMNLMRGDAIRQLGVIYISGLSEQIALHFGTTIELRLSQVEALVGAVPPGRFTNESSLRIGLTHNARSMEFEYLAFYMEDGSFRMIYGPQVTADEPDALQSSVLSGRYNVCAGVDETGVQIVLMGIPAKYSVEDGSTTVALVAGFPTSYLSDTLEGNVKGSMVRYSIIRDDGSYVMQNSMVEETNYFERIALRYDTYNGKTPRQYAGELKEALEENRDYTSEVMLSGERWNVYCTNLPNSEWHLILKTSHNTLDETINTLRRRWSMVSMGGCGIILGVLLLVFLGYYKMTKRQIQELYEARQSADAARTLAERANNAKSEFLSNMSHDIRTPMNGIMGMTAIALNNLENPAKIASCLKRINVSSRHLLGLINDMLDMSKIENGRLSLQMEPISLHDIMQNILTVMQPQFGEKQQQFHIYVYNVQNENIRSDRVRLSQILINILGNAAKFTPKGGTIIMELREELSPKGDAYTRSCLHIRDNGIGMSKEFQERIFEAFAREDNGRVEKEAGAGMGMTITKHIVDDMGGTISVESEQGKGTDFYIVLDMEITGQQEQKMKLPCREVLIIDDDKTANETAAVSLKSIGLDAEGAITAERAFHYMEEHRRKGKDYDIVMVDWDIEGQNGIQTVEELRRRFGTRIPVILLSDGEWDELEADAVKTGVNAFLSKPLFGSTLYNCLRPFAEREIVSEQQKSADDVDLNGRRILVAEDNELNWEIAEAMLSDLGMQLEWAENGQICVDKFGQSEKGWYDAILMDLRMPVMTGFEAASAIRRLHHADAASIPIIAVSADAFPDDIQKCFDCGMNAHTAKPFNLDRVVELLQQYLR